MTLPVYAPAIQPDAEGTTMKMVPRMIETPFGDGYTQRVADGPNYMQEQWNLSYGVLGPDDTAYILNFLNQVSTIYAFTWVAPIPGRSAPGYIYKVTKEGWTYTPVDGQNSKISFSIMQTADFST